ncbi:hypothetical protein P3W43_03435 [Salinicola salarius]|uniref:hypothetical protein n=1 Tax=Salinicola salarius TaxID=430457 RepID=UPI0023E3651C|nr:hypothetical protein [Salinicola salarius]MDF3917909.1 hypothetical protein [Salinicola salarius]
MKTCNESGETGSFDRLEGEGESGIFDDFGRILALKKRIRRDYAAYPGRRNVTARRLIDDFRRVPQRQRKRFADAG